MEKTNMIAYRYPHEADIVQMIDAIWERKYYTNQGPLAVKLELNIQNKLNVDHALVMANANIALLITLLALNPADAMIPSSIPSYVTHSLDRMKINSSAYPCMDSLSSGTPGMLGKLSNGGLLVACHACGMRAKVESLVDCAVDAESDLLIISDNHWSSYQELTRGKTRIIEIHSFDQSQIINGVEGACVLTNDDDLAALIRNIRSSYGAGRVVEAPYTGNGRISEFQAGMALLSLDNLENNRMENRRRAEILCKLAQQSGVGIIDYESCKDGYVVAQEVESGLLESFICLARQQGFQPIDSHYALATRISDGQKRLALFNLNSRGGRCD